MDTGVIIAITGIGVAMVGVMLSMMFWMRGESNDLRKDAKEDRQDILGMVHAIELEVIDFHSRLCEIEKRRKS